MARDGSWNIFWRTSTDCKINLPATPDLHLKEPAKLFYAIIKRCKAIKSRDGFWEHKDLGGLEAVDIWLVQCVVGRIFDQGKRVIIDRSRECAHVDIEPGDSE